ncbi:MAG TPA: glycogen debranching N-terminal domain-containing protein [Ktedonobacteraceae bacterium]|nr:glycogen debranching N-terminal domain-containing protein [Ktedonobacteraceae bacterium]
MSENTISILEGNTFVVSDRRGNIDASTSEPTGLFSWDTRFLSRWVLALDGKQLAILSTDELDSYFSAQFFLAPGTGTTYVDADLSVIRKRSVGNGFHEDLTIANHKEQPVDFQVRLDVAADFADLFEVKDALPKKGTYFHHIEDRLLILGYRREGYVRETWISTTAQAAIDEHGFTFSVHIEPHKEWHACLEVDVEISNMHILHNAVRYQHSALRVRPDMQLGLAKWHQDAPEITSGWPWLGRIYQRSLVDLAALRFHSYLVPGGALPAAGLPWFMTIFGRDSLLTGLQALPFYPEILETTLRQLALQQGTRYDDFRDEEPGKILHEVRFGEMTAFEERPHSPYYGAADSTPLFLVCLDEYERWTGNENLVRELEMEARTALTWIDTSGDLNGDGYVEYDRRNKETGLENQCWKDSWNSILFADGSLARRPLAVCEIQGYVYDAKVRCARLARTFWGDPELARRLEKEAAELKRHFNQDFWVEQREFFALALDGDGRQVDSLTSNIGHLLWSGIVEKEKAEACKRHLMSDQLFSGWGIRTMAEGEGGYNPLGYHIGTVWPHDNSIIALGLRRYGYDEEAARIALAMLEAARFFEGRLPEAFAGYARNLTGFPVEYPTACSPQAWATGTPLLLIRTMLGLEPVGDRLTAHPVVPKTLGYLQMSGIPGRWGHTDIFGKGRVVVPESVDHLERLMI